MATELKVGQSIPFSIAYFDQNGQPMTSAPNPDAPPSWANTNSAAETLTAAPDGLTAQAQAVAEGFDTVRVQLSVGGAQYTATLDVTVLPAVVVPPSQTLTSIQIVPGTPSP